jgi:hypothetical protein
MWEKVKKKSWKKKVGEKNLGIKMAKTKYDYPQKVSGEKSEWGKKFIGKKFGKKLVEKIFLGKISREKRLVEEKS